MLVRLTFGSRAGEVHDFLPREASAMLADGRAVAVDAAPPSPLVIEHHDPVVAVRRAPASGKRRTR
jgi:hypothetical protein